MSERQRQRTEPILSEQIKFLSQALETGQDYLDGETRAHASEVLQRAGTRRELSTEHSVVGLFGATGSGKSTLFNALVGREIARTGVVRPTTRRTVAAIWKQEGSAELLDWLQVTERHSVSEPLQGAASSRTAVQTAGLLLLDLPDMDSTSFEHHEVAARMAGQVDFLVWVLDPQKYADASIHHGFLSTLSRQSSNLLVVLNQVDTLAETDRTAVAASLRKLLDTQGLGEVPMVLASARTGEGLDGIRRHLVSVMRHHEIAQQRVRNDINSLAVDLEAALPVIEARIPSKSSQQRLEHSIAHAHGTGRIADAVATSYRLRAARSTGWPLTTWLTRLRNDPLKRMNLGRNDKPTELALTSRPDLSAAEAAEVDQAVNRYVAEAVDPLPQRWAQPLQDRLGDSAQAMNGPIDLAIASTRLGVERRSWWWPVLKFLQWFSLLFAAVGAVWLGGMALAGFLQFSLPEPPRIEGIAIPTLMLVTGILIGVVLGSGSSVFNRLIARIKRRKALGNLNKSVAQVVRQSVVDPTREHLDRYNDYAALIRQAAKRAQKV